MCMFSTWAMLYYCLLDIKNCEAFIPYCVFQRLIDNEGKGFSLLVKMIQSFYLKNVNFIFSVDK